MTVKMLRLEIIAIKPALHPVVRALRQLGCVQIDPVVDSPDIIAHPLTLNHELLQTQEKTRLLLAKIDGLLSTLGGELTPTNVHEVSDLANDAQSGVEMLMPKVQTLNNRRLELQGEFDSLPRYEATLHKLVPVVPPSAHKPGNMSVGIFVNRAHIGVLEMIGKRVIELTHGKAELVTRDVDESIRAMLLVFPASFADEIEILLGREDVSRLRLPAELETGPPDSLIATLHQRLVVIPQEIQTIEHELNQLAAHWREPLTVWRRCLRDELEAYSVLSSFGETEMTFVITGWVPVRDFETVRQTLQREIGDAIVIRKLPITPEVEKRAPILLDNPSPARPFESLVRLQALPQYGGIDPTVLMAFFLPLFFGMMLGDVAYGGLLLLFTLVLLRRYKTGVISDLLKILRMGSGWSIFFGIVFGEAFGTLGESLGMRPLLFDRASPEHVSSLLALTIGLGAAHIVLGLILGIWDAVHTRSRNHLLERGGMLVGLVALFVIVGVLTDFLPEGFMTPAVGGLIVGIVLLGSSMGWLGVLMGPIEFLSVIGNVMSYLRIAAIGLASVYLAKVANDLAGLAGNLVVGIIIAVLIHALNLVMGVFSPTIHSLRLHYVEFFRKFYEGGGRPYEPFRSQFQ